MVADGVPQPRADKNASPLALRACLHDDGHFGDIDPAVEGRGSHLVHGLWGV